MQRILESVYEFHIIIIIKNIGYYCDMISDSLGHGGVRGERQFPPYKDFSNILLYNVNGMDKPIFDIIKFMYAIRDTFFIHS